MDGINTEFPVTKEGSQPADEIFELYWNMDPEAYEGFSSALQEHAYKLDGLIRYPIQEQVERLQRLNLHRTVTILLDIEEMKKGDSPQLQDRGAEVESMLRDHIKTIVSVITSPTYYLLLVPITYEGLKELRKHFENPQGRLDSNLSTVINREYRRWNERCR